MDLDAITQYILALVPAVTAISGMAVMVGITIGKIKRAISGNFNSLNEALKEEKVANSRLKSELTSLAKDNAELKKELAKLSKKVQHIHFVDKEK